MIRVAAINIGGAFNLRTPAVIAKLDLEDIHLCFIIDHRLKPSSTPLPSLLSHYHEFNLPFFNSQTHEVTHIRDYILLVSNKNIKQYIELIFQNEFQIQIKCLDYLITGIYLKPESRNFALDQLQKSTEKLSNFKQIILGDFNTQMNNPRKVRSLHLKKFSSLAIRHKNLLPSFWRSHKQGLQISQPDGILTNTPKNCLHFKIDEPDQVLSTDHSLIMANLKTSVTITDANFHLPPPFRPSEKTTQLFLNALLSLQHPTNFHEWISNIKTATAMVYTPKLQQKANKPLDRRLQRALEQGRELLRIKNRMQKNNKLPLTLETSNKIRKNKARIKYLQKKIQQYHIKTAIQKLQNTSIIRSAKIFNNLFDKPSPPITAIRSSQNKIITKKEDFLAELQQQYTQASTGEAFLAPSPNLEHFPLFTTENIFQAIKDAPKGSSPGPDRITYETLKILPDHYKNLLPQFFNEILNNRSIPPSWRTSTTTLIPKTGSPLELKNYRPIALLDTTYKIFTKILARYTTETLEHSNYLHPLQHGFRPNKGTSSHAANLLNHILKCKNTNSTFFILFHDFKKAFDSLKQEWIFQQLSKTPLPPTIKYFINALYFNTTTQLITGYGLTDPIPITKGTRQGCPLSPVLFCICIDPIVRHCNLEADTQAFADDLASITTSLATIKKILAIVKKYEEPSGLSLNISSTDSSKTAILTNCPPLTLKNQLNTSPVEAPILKPHESYKYLGFLMNTKDPIQTNFKKCQQSIWAISNTLKRKAFSIDQCINIVNSIIMSKLRYLSQVIPLSPTQICNLDNPIISLLKQKMHLKGEHSIKHFQIPKTAGGYGLQDLHQIQYTSILLTANKINDPNFSYLTPFLTNWKDTLKVRVAKTNPPPNLKAINHNHFLPGIWNEKHKQKNQKAASDAKTNAESFNSTLENLSTIPNHIKTQDKELIWTDGSLRNKNGSAAVVVGTTPFTFQTHTKSSFEQELLAVHLAAHRKNATIITDSLSTIQALKNPNYRSTNDYIQRVIQATKKLIKEHNITLEWIPGHQDPDNPKPRTLELASNLETTADLLVTGNILADETCQRQSIPWPNLDPFCSKICPYTKDGIIIRNWKHHTTTLLQENICKRKTSANFMIKSQKLCIPNPPLTRTFSTHVQSLKRLAFLIATEKLPVREYLYGKSTRRQYQTPLCPICNRFHETVDHFLTCPRTQSLQRKMESILKDHRLPQPLTQEQVRLIASGKIPKAIVPKGYNGDLGQLQTDLMKTVQERWKLRNTILFN